MIKYRLPDSLPDNVKLSFFEYQRREWEKIVETSEDGLKSENQAESLGHWQQVNLHAKERIRELDEKVELLKIVKKQEK